MGSLRAGDGASSARPARGLSSRALNRFMACIWIGISLLMIGIAVGAYGWYRYTHKPKAALTTDLQVSDMGSFSTYADL